MVTTQPILSATGLTMEFRGFLAVKDVTLSVNEGTVHALIGPNGAGKTTVFNLLTKFLTPTRGQITFKGSDITGLKPAEVARLGLVRSFQISAVFPHLTRPRQRARGAAAPLRPGDAVLALVQCPLRPRRAGHGIDRCGQPLVLQRI